MLNAIMLSVVMLTSKVSTCDKHQKCLNVTSIKRVNVTKKRLTTCDTHQKQRVTNTP
jgi:hypothetical protein